jgi:hypothetical protein
MQSKTAIIKIANVATAIMDCAATALRIAAIAAILKTPFHLQ